MNPRAMYCAYIYVLELNSQKTQIPVVVEIISIRHVIYIIINPKNWKSKHFGHDLINGESQTDVFLSTNKGKQGAVFIVVF